MRIARLTNENAKTIASRERRRVNTGPEGAYQDQATATRMIETNARKRQMMRFNPTQSTRRRGFTLLELMVVIAIMAILTAIATLVFKSATNSAILAQAHNTLSAYARLARSYAIANQIETMMVVNPYNGRIEVWYANPPASGGQWDPLSPGTATGSTTTPAPFTNGYLYAPVFDSGARVPVDGSGTPRVVVNPIDFYDYANNVALRPTANDQRNMDNLRWAALCFDPSGSLVTRTRRISTVHANAARLPDAQPDLSVLTNPALNKGDRVLVSQLDSPITSTHGFVLSDSLRMASRLGGNFTPADLVNEWLRYTIAPAPGESAVDLQANVSDAADVMVFNRFSGQEVARVD